MRQALYAAGMLIVLASVATTVSAGITAPVPEIDGSSVTAGLGLLTGGVLVVRARLRR
ncbi:hypothetical protein BH18ACI5_BH18ACI5_14990 [soil metagenome]